MAKENITKNQHYIPQVYLRGFSLDNKHVCRYDVKTGEQKTDIPIKSIFAEKYLYEKRDENGLTEPNRIENLLCKFEEEFAQRREHLMRLASNSTNCKTNCFLTADEKLFWKKYIILQMIRHKDSLKKVENMAANQLKKFDKEKIKNIAIEYCLSMYSDVKPNAYDWFLPIFKNAAINIGYDETGSLFTNEHCGTFNGTGRVVNEIAEWDLVCFPISRFLMFYMFNMEVPKYQNHAKNKLIWLHNENFLTAQKTIACSAQKVIISPNPLTKEEIQFIPKEAQNVIL